LPIFKERNLICSEKGGEEGRGTSTTTHIELYTAEPVMISKQPQRDIESGEPAPVEKNMGEGVISNAEGAPLSSMIPKA